jgi:hypothetical protein
MQVLKVHQQSDKDSSIVLENASGIRKKNEPEQLLDGRYKYLAFLSYRTGDARQAGRLHKKLESYIVPRSLVGTKSEYGRVPRRLGRVFRDRDETRTSLDIETIIADELTRSQQLIVLCTPNAAAPGSWVDREIDLFRKRRPDGAIHAVIGAGEPPGCFPRALLTTTDGRTEAPLAADLRPRRDGGPDGERKAVVRLIAGLLGVPFDNLWRREMRRRRLRLLAQFAAASAVAFVLFATIHLYRNEAAMADLYRAQATNSAVMREVASLAGAISDGSVKAIQDPAVERLIIILRTNPGLSAQILDALNSKHRDDIDINCLRDYILYSATGDPSTLEGLRRIVMPSSTDWPMESQASRLPLLPNEEGATWQNLNVPAAIPFLATYRAQVLRSQLFNENDRATAIKTIADHEFQLLKNDDNGQSRPTGLFIIRFQVIRTLISWSPTAAVLSGVFLRLWKVRLSFDLDNSPCLLPVQACAIFEVNKRYEDLREGEYTWATWLGQKPFDLPDGFPAKVVLGRPSFPPGKGTFLYTVPAGVYTLEVDRHARPEWLRRHRALTALFTDPSGKALSTLKPATVVRIINDVWIQDSDLQN